MAQTYPDKEVIVVDDGSTDNSRQVIESREDRIRAIIKANGGQRPATRYLKCRKMNELFVSETLERIQEALEQAAETLKPFESGFVEARLKEGDELVTEADHAVNRALYRVLHRNGEGWLSEESLDDRSRLQNDRVWIVDPIDGTREFVARIPEWCVSIAFVRGGVAVAGGIMNPATGETFLGSAGQGLTYVGSGVSTGEKESLNGATVLASRSEVKRGEWDAFCNSTFSKVPMGSVAYKLARVAAGLADATWTLAPKHEWDVAAGVALIEATGGFVRTLDFCRPVFNREDVTLRGLMASSRKLESEIVKLLRPHVARHADNLEATGPGGSRRRAGRQESSAEEHWTITSKPGREEIPDRQGEWNDEQHRTSARRKADPSACTP